MDVEENETSKGMGLLLFPLVTVTVTLSTETLTKLSVGRTGNVAVERETYPEAFCSRFCC